MLHLRRYFAALAVLSLLCGTYWLAAAPWVEPPPIRGPQFTATATPVAISPQVQIDLQRLFPPGSWELDPATKVVETDQCTLLIQDYLPTPDGLLKLNPCTLVFYSKAAAGSRRPVVMQAPAGAVLKFDKALDVTKATFGRLIGGNLKGEIRIFSPPSSPTARDGLTLTTSDVFLDREIIKTVHNVEFQYGDSQGRGQGLEIQLRQVETGPDGKKKKAGMLGGMQSLLLRRLDFVRIQTEGPGLLGEALAGQQNSARNSEPLEIKCQGNFSFDVIAQVAHFIKNVEVTRLRAGLPPDKLTCDELLLTFLLKQPEAEASAAQPEAAPQTATAKPADPLAGRLQRILALGSPAVLEAPSSGISARAAWMEYEMPQRRITLRPDGPQTQPQRVKQVSLQQLEQHFTARELQYELAPAGGLGRMWAAGPGEIKLLQGRGAAQQAIVARWEKELWVRPDEQNHVISLLQAACIIAEPLGRFDADELHLWVLEVPAEPVAAQSPPAQPAATTPLAEQPPAAATKPAKKPRMTLVPARMWAKGHVQLTSPKLDAKTSDLQAWFINLPPAAEVPGGPPLNLPGPLREPVAQAAFQQNVAPSGAIRNVIRPPSLQKFRVEGDKIQMQLAVQGRKFDLDDLIVERQATIDETRTPEPGQEPIHIAGDLLKLRHGTTPQAKIEISGQPAEVAGRGMWMAAGMIHVHRGENRLWIDGPGEATLPAPPEQSLQIMPNSSPPAASERRQPPDNLHSLPANHREASAPAKPPQKLHLLWQQGLNFDGEVAKLTGDVHARTATQTATAPVLEATLSRKLDLLAPAGRQRPELAKIRLEGGVFMTNRGLNDLGEQVSFEQMQVPNLTVDWQNKTLHADGPGWVSSVRRSDGLPGVPGAGNAAGQPAQPPIQQPGAVPTNQQPLTSVHIEFEQALTGKLDKREIEFLRDVRTTYSPAQDFADRIVVVSAADLTEKAMLMTCDRLKVTEMVTPVRRWLEGEATGHTILEGQKVTANTPGRITYTSATEYVTIEGDGRADAYIYLRSAPGEQVSPQTVKSFRYNIRTGAFDGDIKRLEFFIPGKAKLPGR